MYTSESVNIKSSVINNIMMQMSMYVDRDAVDEDITEVLSLIDEANKILEGCENEEDT